MLRVGFSYLNNKNNVTASQFMQANYNFQLQTWLELYFPASLELVIKDSTYFEKSSQNAFLLVSTVKGIFPLLRKIISLKKPKKACTKQEKLLRSLASY